MFSASFQFGILGVLKLYSIATHTFALCSVPGFHDDLFEVTVEMRPSMFFCCTASFSGCGMLRHQTHSITDGAVIIQALIRPSLHMT